jgi:hypothetical protein
MGWGRRVVGFGVGGRGCWSVVRWVGLGWTLLDEVVGSVWSTRLLLDGCSIDESGDCKWERRSWRLGNGCEEIGRVGGRGRSDGFSVDGRGNL